jgi:hypothetical protein
MQKNCNKCGAVFNCTNENAGCWCGHVQLDPATLIQLKKAFGDCLCPACLKAYEHKQTAPVVNA